MMDIWQKGWTDVGTGGLIHEIFPKVKQRLTDWRREDFLFFTRHGPFGQYLKRFNLKPTSYCACKKEGSPIHYVKECHSTESWQITEPAVHVQSIWPQRVASNPLSRFKKMQTIGHIHENPDLF
ncbi:hypothetical protein AVEN_241407-1 [Araneus ventricosus]|uniref:Reverse transcriptase zinc-binding domain-containing protein n=1 Tax=Araneus ventricosus TaxID=182803 RepID=A0A4Y2M6J6_ARAVE|nr:hypothetical protein AVEN_241407-1 [Araneus ventricosus]